MGSSRHRLAIAVVPRLFGDALSRALASDDREVVVVGAGQEPHGSQPADPEDHFDIAVVSGQEHNPPASVVIRLPDSPASGLAQVAGEPVVVEDLEGLVALVGRCAAALAADPPVGV